MKKEWKKGNRAFYWTKDYEPHPLCLQSKEYNRTMKGNTWVYYSKKDAKQLYKFLKNIFEKPKTICSKCGRSTGSRGLGWEDGRCC